MKINAFFFLLLLTLFSLSSCELLKDAAPDITLNVDGSVIIFSLPETEEARTFTFTRTGVPSDVAETLDDENINQDRVESVKLERAEFRIATSDNSVDFTDVDRVTLTVSAPGLGTITLSEMDFTPINSDQVSLIVDPDAELLDYLLAPQADYTLTVITNGPVVEESRLRVTPRFRVTAKPI